MKSSGRHIHSGFLPFFVVLLLLFISVVRPPAAGGSDAAERSETSGENPRVLVLHSYHVGFTWADNVTQGIRTVFGRAAPDTELLFEYMDVKRIHEPDYLLLFRDLLTRKYRGRRIDLVITVDDHALNFTLGPGAGLFRGIPVVFCAVNDYDPRKHRRADGILTGVVESIDIKATLDIALRLHPGTTQVVYVADGTLTGQALRRAAENVFNAYGTRFDTRYLEHTEMADLQQEVSELSRGTILLAFIFSRDARGRVWSHEYNLRRLAAHCTVPIYSVWEFYLGHGIVGGMLTSGRAHGREAAEMALRILADETSSTPPVILESPNRYMFDYRQLDRFHIRESSLPEQSLIVNRPFSVLETYKWEILGLGFVILLLVVLAAVLFFAILQRRRVERALLESERRFSLFMDHLPAAAFIKDDQSRAIYVNRYIDDVFGGKEWRGKTPLELYPENVARKMIADDRSTLSGGHLTVLETLMDRQGSEHIFETHKFRIDRREDSPLIGGVAVDITERKRGEMDRERLRGQLESALEMARMGHWEYDVAQDRFTFNDHFYKIFRTTAEAVGGYTMSSAEYAERFVHPEDRKIVREEIRRAIEAPSPEFSRRLEHRMIYADGGTGHISVRFSIVKDDGGKTIRSYGVNQDISDRKEMETRLIRAQKLESIGSLAGGIAHDFNNLLFPIIGISEMLLEDLPTGGPVHRNIQEILSAGRRGGDLVKQILAFSRQSEQKKIPFQIQQVLKEVLLLGRSTIPSNIEIQRDIRNDCGPVMADPTQIHQIAMNLITNAYHAVEPGGGSIRIGLAEETVGEDDPAGLSPAPGRYAVLSVSDTGRGMDQTTMEKIFEPYFTTKEPGKGTGLGLAVVYGIVKEHQGDIRVHSVSGQGTTFKIYLPLIKRPVAPRAPETAKDLPTGDERVLLVDDEDSIAGLLKLMLEKLGYRVEKKTSSIEALEAFRTDPAAFDLVVSDMNMPNLTGEQLSREILAIRPEIPMIICTGFSERLNQETADEMGISAVLLKPVLRTDLARTVRSVLDKAKARPAGTPLGLETS